jgi:hypothetical protein
MTATLDLRQEVRRSPVSIDAVAALDDVCRQAAIAEWTGRMVNEHVSARVFAALLRQMMCAGVDATFQRAAGEAVVQELRHARLCAAVVEALGGTALAPMPELDEVPRHDDVGPLEALLRNVIAVACLNETVAVALLESDRQLVTDSVLRGVITEILADEVGHSRLGWRLLENLAPRIDAAMRERLGQYLVPAFAQLFGRHFSSPEAARPPAVEALGVEDRLDATALFLNVVNDVIIPRLEAFGLPARAAVREALTTTDAGDEPAAWAATD